jgi:hypothetical protein
VLFIEDFSYIELISFVSAILCSNKKINRILILLRYSKNSFSFIIYIINILIISKGIKIDYFTDSEILKSKWSDYLKMDVATLPIPIDKINIRSIENYKKVWWPGYPRKEKGLNIIIKLVIMNNNISFYLNQIMKKYHYFDNSKNIIYLDEILEKKQYNDIFSKVRYIILPYDELRYSESTSGIFVEAVLYKKIPIVQKNTWMASELEKFSLNELILDFNYIELEKYINYIEKISSDKLIFIKLNIMRYQYEKFHNIDNYSKILKFNLFKD